MRASRIMFWTFACLLPVTVLVTFVTDGFGGGAHVEFLGAVLWLANGALLVAAICMVGFERGRWRTLMLTGIVASAGALLAWGAIAWKGTIAWHHGYDPDLAPLWFTAATFLTAFPIGCALAGLILRIPLVDRPSRILRGVVLLIGALAVVHITAAVAVYPLLELEPRASREYEERHMRWAAIWIVLIGAGLIACVGSHSLRKFMKGAESIVPPRPIRLTCPRCALAQQLQTQGDACARCGLRINVSMVSIT